MVVVVVVETGVVVGSAAGCAKASRVVLKNVVIVDAVVVARAVW